jgi:tetratricopeptide (TPR) repeat protein
MKILSIFASTETANLVEQFIHSEYRLSELIDIQVVSDWTSLSPIDKLLSMTVKDHHFQINLDWYNQIVPYIFPTNIPFNQASFLGSVFGLLGNFEKTWEYLAHNPLLKDWDIFVRILNGYPIDIQGIENQLVSDSFFEKYRACHNLALIYNYSYPNEADSLQKIQNYYHQATEIAPEGDYLLFTIKHSANFLLDIGQIGSASILLENAIPQIKNQKILASFKFVWVQLMIKELVVPYDAKLLAVLKENLWETLQFYESQNCLAESALLLIDASFIANIEESFSESLAYINKAIKYLTEEELLEMLGNAQFRKGILLYTWSKNGNPQFYKSALEAFQAALKIFDKENAPDIFADIHHHLGIIYSEMPDENKKRGVWAALSASSFKEALTYFNKMDFPYEYATISNNYANAMTLYPPMKKADNYAKALELYEEALHIRNARHYPYERALTLINYLEASWYVSNEEDVFNESRYQDMKAKALEIKQLVDNENLLMEANKHLEELEKLKSTISL